MALADLVVDTNVLEHCSCGQPILQLPAIEFAQRLILSPTVLAIDKGGLIQAEYLSRLRAGTLGYVVVATLAGKQRVAPVDVDDVAVNKKTNQLVKKPRDRTFLRVAAATQDKLLVSHDFEDFQQSKRPAIKKAIGVLVLEAEAATPLL